MFVAFFTMFHAEPDNHKNEPVPAVPAARM